MKSNLKVVNTWAAGGVIINREGISVILCYREKDSLWTLPKGKPEENETKEITSLREVKEETGLDVKIVQKIGTTNHKFQNDNYASKLIDFSNYKNIIFHKDVHWYLMDYTGGNTKNPTYKEVCTGQSGHVEVIQIDYDPTILTFEKLLDVFWKSHDPTTLNRQGGDVGTQYRSVIFYTTPEQESVAIASKNRLEKSGILENPIVTEISAANKFFKAEEYHQQYFKKHGISHCRIS